MDMQKEDWAGAVLFFAIAAAAVALKENLLWVAAAVVGYVFLRRRVFPSDTKPGF